MYFLQYQIISIEGLAAQKLSIVVASRTLLVYTSVTPCLMHNLCSRKGTVFVLKHGKKHAKAQIRHTLGTFKARFKYC